MNNQSLSTGDVSKLCKVNISSVNRWIKKGLLRASQFGEGGRHRILISDFIAFCRKNNIEVPEELKYRRAPVALVVEDERDVAAVIRRILQSAGFETHHARSGFEAGILACSIKPDLITLDLRMPGMSGIETLAQVRATEVIQGVKVLVISGMGEDMLQEALRTGADDILRKPFDVNDLLEKVRSLLPEYEIGGAFGSS
ncbi:MAG: response regulator [Planctomycetes bacterium]|nr:response regulator [Planctomycetota bacterium]